MNVKNRMFIKVGSAIGFVIVAALFVFLGDNDFESARKEIKEMKAGAYQDFYHTITVPIGESSNNYIPGYRLKALEESKKKSLYLSDFSDTLVWIPRGPYNVGGRARTVIVDPDDQTNMTWYAGSAGGGIWKTTNGGDSWSDLTPELPNLATVALTMADSDHDVIFAGTGEGFGGVGMITGEGIFKTTDRGLNWTRIESTSASIFDQVNRIWVDPTDVDVLVVATNDGIFRTEDGGADWDTTYMSNARVQDIKMNPENKNTLYASVNTLGILKSYDAGINWEFSSNGISGVKRMSLAVSPVDTSYVFASAETVDGDMLVYITTDAGENWIRNGKDDKFFNFHNAQGWYNNAIAADPYIKEKVYIAGVYAGALTFSSTAGATDPVVQGVDTLNTASFIGFINFGGAFLGGGMATGLDEGAAVAKEDFTSVEIRFGAGMTQKAARFQVPDGEGPGVAAADYTYIDYVDVPFEVWDVTNNKQLMVSFRDQERDGAFNLITRDPDDAIPGREYMFVHAIDYDATNPHVEVSKDGGHYYKMTYFFWPTLAEGGTWDASNLPESQISIKYGSFITQSASTEIFSSSSYDPGIHVDHHEIVVIGGATAGDERTILTANDGGIALSKNTGADWKQLDKGLYTTQFYGVAKMPGKEVYIGGLQDNGTWRSPLDKSATDSLNYKFMLGGDGFEVLWHSKNEDDLIGSIYNNKFYRSSDGGKSWKAAVYGLGDTGPFISKLSHSRQTPDTIYTIDAAGVYRNTKFANAFAKWELTEITEGLTINGSASSSIDVEVSKADPAVVWAGQGMFESPSLDIFVSSDYGESFAAVTKYPGADLGYISAIATHPVNPDVAYLLFSYQGAPKILRTEDRGTSWEDISGFDDGELSTRGFPDVVVLSLLVMPEDPSVIWAGTEIGIVESTDNGDSWHLLDSKFPNVTVYQMLYQDHQIVLGTHGRGIWTAGDSIQKIESHVGQVYNEVPEELLSIYPNPASSDLYIKSGMSRGDVSITIYGTDGKKVYSEKQDIEHEGETLHVDLSSMTSGNYVLVVDDNLKRRSINFIIK